MSSVKSLTAYLRENGFEGKNNKFLEGLVKKPEEIWDIIGVKKSDKSKAGVALERLKLAITGIYEYLDEDFLPVLVIKMVKEIFINLLSFTSSSYKSQEDKLFRRMDTIEFRDIDFYMDVIAEFFRESRGIDALLDEFKDWYDDSRNKENILTFCALFDTFQSIYSITFDFEDKFPDIEPLSGDEFRLVYYGFSDNVFEYYGYMTNDDNPETKYELLLNGLEKGKREKRKDEFKVKVYEIETDANKKLKQDFLDEAEIIRGESITSVDGAVCPKCKSTNSTFEQLQTRASDEQAAINFSCSDCGARWKR